MFDNFLPIPDTESLPFYPLVLKLDVCENPEIWIFYAYSMIFWLNSITIIWWSFNDYLLLISYLLDFSLSIMRDYLMIFI